MAALPELGRDAKDRRRDLSIHAAVEPGFEEMWESGEWAVPPLPSASRESVLAATALLTELGVLILPTGDEGQT